MAFAQAVNTSTSVWRNGQADTVQLDAFEALLRILVQFMADKPVQSVSYVGTGNGTINFIDGGVGGVTQTWTIALTSATAFTVTGSVSGAQAGGTVGVNYTTTGNPLTSLVSFLLTAGGTAFVAADAFTITDTTNAIPAADVWVLDAWNPFDLFDQSNPDGTPLWWHGEGDGTQAIYCGIALFVDAGTSRWNWRLRAGTGFSSSALWSAQPGTSLEVFSAFWNNDMLYWLIGNARRYSVAARVSTTFHAMYQGLFLAFGSPTEFPLPIVNMGESKFTSAWNSAASTFHSPWLPADETGAMRDVSGTWLPFDNSVSAANVQAWPSAAAAYSANSVWDNHENFNNGDHQLFPIVLHTGPTGGVGAPLTETTYGVLEGIRRVTGFGNSAETILTISTVDHVVFQDIFRTTRQSFWTMEMA